MKATTAPTAGLDLTLPEHLNEDTDDATWWECPRCSDYAWLWPNEDEPECSCPDVLDQLNAFERSHPDYPATWTSEDLQAYRELVAAFRVEYGATWRVRQWDSLDTRPCTEDR